MTGEGKNDRYFSILWIFGPMGINVIARLGLGLEWYNNSYSSSSYGHTVLRRENDFLSNPIFTADWTLALEISHEIRSII
jgi:hypothetical protein